MDTDVDEEADKTPEEGKREDAMVLRELGV